MVNNSSRRRKSNIDPPTFNNTYMEQQQKQQQQQQQQQGNINNALIMTAIIEEGGEEEYNDDVDMKGGKQQQHRQQKQQVGRNNNNLNDDDFDDDDFDDDEFHDTCWEQFKSYYFWQLLAWICIQVSVAAIALYTTPVVILMSTIGLVICVQVIVRRSKIRQWDELYSEYEFQKMERDLERLKNKKLDNKLEMTERKLIKCFRKEKKLKKILKKSNENTLANGKKLKRLTKQHLKQVEKQRKFITDELQYQSLSAAVSIMTGFNKKKKKKKSKKKSKKKKSKKNISFSDDSSDSDEDEDEDDDEPNRQQMEYFLEMMEEFPFLKFDPKAFSQIQDPMETILLETSTANVILPDEDEKWYPHSNKLWSKLMDSPYSSHKTGKAIILTKEEEKIASRFRKMLKLGIQKEAARMKMQAENIDIRIQCSVLGEELPDEVSESSDAINDLSIKKKAKRYFHWQSLYHPDHLLIKQKQMLTPVFEEEKKDESNPTTTITPAAGPSLGSGTDNYLMNELPPAGGEEEDGEDGKKKYIVASSIWMKASRQQIKNTLTKDDSVMKKHIEMYMKQPPPAETLKNNNNDTNNLLANNKDSSKKTDKANIVDLNRARNIDITLKSFKDFTHEELATIIQYVDPKKKIKGDRLLMLNALLPTPIELKSIADYGDGPEYRLVQCEKWFKHLLKIKRIEDKTSAMKTMGTFDDIVSFLDTNFTLVIQACDQVMTSEKLQDVLAIILEMGNQMNNPDNQQDNEKDLTGSAPPQLQPPNYNRSMSAPNRKMGNQSAQQSGRRRKKIKDNKFQSAPVLKGPKPAAGFHLEFLTQMSYTKGSDKTTTAIDLLVTILVEQNQRSTLLLKEDIPDCTNASDIQMTTLKGDLSLLDMSVNQLEREYHTLQKENKKKWTPPSSTAAKRGGGGIASKFGMNQAALANQLGKIHASRNNPGGEAMARADMHNALQKELLAKKLVNAEQSSPGKPAAEKEANPTGGGGGGGKFDMHKDLLAKKLGKIHNNDNNAGEGTVAEADEAAGGGGKFNMHKELLAKKLGKVHAGGGPGGPPKSPGGGTKSNTTVANGGGGGGGGGDLDATIKRMGDFLGGAKGKVQDLKDKSEKAKLACWKLSEFFCEPPSENSANSLFSILDEFSNNLDQSLKKCDERLGKEAKKKEKSEKAKAKVRNVVEDLKMNLRVTGMLQSLRKDADRWGVIRNKVLKGKKPTNTQSATSEDDDDDRLVKSERQRHDGDVKGWDAIAAFVGSSNHSKALKKRQVSKFTLSKQPSKRQSIRQSIQQEMSVRAAVSPTRQRRSSLRNSLMRSMEPEGKSLRPPMRYAASASTLS